MYKDIGLANLVSSCNNSSFPSQMKIHFTIIVVAMLWYIVAEKSPEKSKMALVVHLHICCPSGLKDKPVALLTIFVLLCPPSNNVFCAPGVTPTLELIRHCFGPTRKGGGVWSQPLSLFAN